MERITIVPENEESWLKLRTEDLTSTDMSALFGISPYMTPYELWHRKKSKEVIKLEIKERMKWGNRLEESIAKGVADDNSWNVRHMPEYMRLPEHRIGSSFDFAIDEDGLMEVKNVDSLAFKDGWMVEGENMEAPPHIELQAQNELLVSGREYIYIAALIGGNRVALIRREADEKIQKAIITKATAFWKSIDTNSEPRPDFVKDAKFISSLYKYADPTKILDATGNEKIDRLVTSYKLHGTEEKEAKKLKDAAKAELLTIIDDAEKVISDKFSISAGIIGATHVEYDRDAYRDFRISMKKVKVTA